MALGTQQSPRVYLALAGRTIFAAIVDENEKQTKRPKQYHQQQIVENAISFFSDGIGNQNTEDIDKPDNK